MRVYSGECEIGLCGLKTPLIDSLGKVLFVGDIVVMLEICMGTMWLSVVVDDRPELAGRVEKGNPFIMGFHELDFMKDKDWCITRVKSYKDVIAGEHWKDFGFNFRKD